MARRILTLGESSTVCVGVVADSQATGSQQRRNTTMENVHINTLANVVTAVCAVLITIKIF